MRPLLTLALHDALRAAAKTGAPTLQCSLDLNRSTTTVDISATQWTWEGKRFPYLDKCKDRTIYFWDGAAFQVAARFANSLIKLVPTSWGPPTFEIDGIKMLPTARVSPFADAERKVALVQPRGKVILDTCGGLGYFAEWCLRGGAAQIQSYEKNPDIIWLRSINPWSPAANQSDHRLTLIHGDIALQLLTLQADSFDAVLHDPPRFGIAGELYSQTFYNHLARVLKRQGRLFHYTGTPNKISRGRDLPGEVAARLRRAGFAVSVQGDGLLGVKS